MPNLIAAFSHHPRELGITPIPSSRANILFLSVSKGDAAGAVANLLQIMALRNDGVAGCYCN